MSVHHGNTLKVAQVIAGALGANVVESDKVNAEDLKNYDLIGFGSGVYNWKLHGELLRLADSLPELSDKKAFIFSTSGYTKQNIIKWHASLREKLTEKGLKIVGEFNCVGWDSNGPLKLVGGINKNRPNAQDLENAAAFAKKLIKKIYEN